MFQNFIKILFKTISSERFKRLIRNIPWTPIICFGFVFWAGKTVVDSDLAVAMVMMLKRPMDDLVSDKLRRKNKADWWNDKNGVHSAETERNANAREWQREFTKLCKLKVDAKNLHKIPKTGKLIVIANHDNPNAGHFLCACVDEVRKNDNARVLSTDDWSRNITIKLVNDDGYMQNNSHAIIKEHLDKGSALVIFPRTGDYYTARQDKVKPTFRFMDGFLRFAIENECHILPAHVRLEYPLWWRILWWIVPLHLGNRMLNTFFFNIYSNTTMHITFGEVIPFSEVSKDESKFYIKRGKKRYPDSILRKYEMAINKLMR